MSTQMIKPPLKQAETGILELRLKQTRTPVFWSVCELVDLQQFKGETKTGSKTRRTSFVFNAGILWTFFRC